ncbi:MAG: phage portal protein [Bdellovibrionales bacterium]
MRLSDLVKPWLRSKDGAGGRGGASSFPPHLAAKMSAAGPMIAWSGVGQPRWTSRNYAGLAEEGFRKNVIAYRCVTQIATACASVPWLLYDARGAELERHPLLDLLRHPNPTQDGVSFLETVYAHLQISGNAYVEAVRPRDGAKPVELYALRPDRMQVIPGATGLPQGYRYNVNGQATTWPADPVTGESAILHLKCFHPLDDWYGLAPMEAALLSIDQHNAAGAWNQSLLNHGARPSGALVYAPKDGPATLTDDQVRRLKEELSQMYQGSRNAGRPLLLEGGLEWREMSLSPRDMDWLAGRNAAARDIALAFGVPAQMVGIPDSQTYANMEQARLAFYEETALPLLTRVIAGFDHWLAPMFGAGLELDYDPDDISALAARREAQWSRIDAAGFLTRNEKREAAGYGPIAGGDGEDLKHARASSRKYNPDQPRVPAGDSDGGQWTSGGGGSGSDGGSEEDYGIHDPPINPVYPVEVLLTSLASLTAGGVSAVARTLLGSLAREAVDDKIGNAAQAIEDFFGGKPDRTFRNDAGDLIMMKGDKKIRFDINNYSPHDEPHFHIQELNSEGKWVSSGDRHWYPFRKE